jgi:pilus assembly protein CpaE
MAAQQRKALIVSGAAGPQDVANSVLGRFGFAPAATALSFGEATALVRAEPYDLLVVPLQNTDAGELAALERESRRHTGMFVIGTAAHADSELIVRAMRSGVHEFLVYPPEATDFASAVDRLMRRVKVESTAGRVLAVFSAKGGLGTSSVATNLAFTLAAARPDGRVALVDMVPGGDLRVTLALRPQYDMADLVRKVDQMDAELLQSLLTPCAGGVWVLPAAEDEDAGASLDETGTSLLVQQLSSRFAYTVVDCEHHISERTLATLDAADRVLLVTQLNVAAMRAAQRMLGLFGRLGYQDDKVHVVVNRYQTGGMITLEDARAVLKRDVTITLPNDYKTSEDALMQGAPTVVHAGATPLAASYRALAAQLGVGAGAAANGKPTAQPAASKLGRLLSLGKR